jgi:hypothetical protein
MYRDGRGSSNRKNVQAARDIQDAFDDAAKIDFTEMLWREKL